MEHGKEVPSMENAKLLFFLENQSDIQLLVKSNGLVSDQFTLNKNKIY